MVYEQLYKYLDCKGLIFQGQSGFRRGYSTETALGFLADEIRLGMDKGLMTGMALLDLQKAFDTVDHTILIDKLGAMGVSSNSREWFSSYLSGRTQFVYLKGEKSEFEARFLGPSIVMLESHKHPTSVDG